jgi:hypothetical protein
MADLAMVAAAVDSVAVVVCVVVVMIFVFDCY